MQTNGKCNSCKNAQIPSNSKGIGEDVYHEMAIGKGYDRTDFKFFQCLDCGSIWVQYKDSGAGGHGNFSKNLTNKLF